METNIVKLETPELEIIEKSKAAQIKATFEPMVNMLEGFEGLYNEIVSESENGRTSDTAVKAKRLRLDIGKVRINSEKAKTKLKENLLLEGRAIDGINNILKWAVTDKEKGLKEIEDHEELIEKERIDELQKSRETELQEYGVETITPNLGEMNELVWNNYLVGVKTNYKIQMDAEKKAKQEIIEKEKALKLFDERKEKLMPYTDFCNIKSLTIDTTKDEFDKMLHIGKEGKKQYEFKQEQIRKEHERLKKEVEAKELERQKEEEKKKQLILKQRSERKKQAIIFLESSGYEKDQFGHTAKEYHHFIGSKHYDDLETDRELESFKNDIKIHKEKEDQKEKEEKEKAVRDKKERKDREAQEAILKIEREMKERVQAELKAKEESEQKEKEKEEARKQVELNKGDKAKVQDLISDMESLKTKYTFKSKKSQKMYTDVQDLIDKVIGHINSK